MQKLLLRIFFCLIISTLINGCVRQTVASSAAITTFHEGTLALSANADAPKLVYVDVQQNTRIMPRLAKDLGVALASGKFRLTDAPSKAGHILHVNILQEGSCNPESVRAAVKAGYGQKARFSGSGSRAILADALMVQRKVPTHKRPSRQRLKNISHRNALGSAQMRLAVLHNSSRQNVDLSKAIAQELARQIEAAPRKNSEKR